jgi:two-component system response regulator LytT
MSAIKILIIEDEVLIAEHIKDYLVSFGFSQVFLVHTKKIALQSIDFLKPDLILLDLHLQQPKDGLDLAAFIDERGGPPYIFVTANADILSVQEAMHTKACGYITKPVKKADLFACIQLALKTLIKTETAFLLIKENNSNVKLNFDEILYIESSSNYINIFTKSRKMTARQSLEWAELELPENRFMRVHRSYIINVSAIRSTTSKSVFIGETEIPISRGNVSKMADYLGKKSK